jgi:hypothetical protein
MFLLKLQLEYAMVRGGYNSALGYANNAKSKIRPTCSQKGHKQQM